MRDSLIQTASKLGINPEWLYKLIGFESNHNPQAKNRLSSAKGLIQIIDSSAKELGFLDSNDLITKYPDYDSQMLNPVYYYLKKYMPFTTEQSLYMAVFYPKFRFVPVDTPFPSDIVKSNPGIHTVRDYIRKVNPQFPSGAAFIALMVLTMLFLKKFV